MFTNMKSFTFLALATVLPTLAGATAIAKHNRHASPLDNHGPIIIIPRSNQTMEETAEELRRDSKLTTGESLTKRAPGRIPSVEKLAAATERGRTLIEYMQDPDTVPKASRESRWILLLSLILVDCGIGS